MHSIDATWQNIVSDGEGVLSFDDMAANDMLFRYVKIPNMTQTWRDESNPFQ